MIARNHQLTYRNVASKIYQFEPEEIDLAFQDFDEILTSQGYQPTGELFFSILSDPTAEVMVAEIYLPIEESHFRNRSNEEVSFRSYFFMKSVVTTRIMEDFDAASQVKFWELVDHLERNGMEQNTPMFVEFKSTYGGVPYVEMSLGYK